MKPNILFILAEDICPNLGCYGDKDAITPNIDKLAAKGVRFNHASSVGPICAPARTTLALGMYPTTIGAHHMRSCVPKPPNFRIISEYMQDAGYFCTINKTDYNFRQDNEKTTNADGVNVITAGWDASIPRAYPEDSPETARKIAQTWRLRKENQPFFMMCTIFITHQSQYGKYETAEEHRKKVVKRTTPNEYRDRSTLTLPDYTPNTPAARELWGQYHETITAMDRITGEILDCLKNDGLEDDTIVIFVGDNGMGIPPGKSYVWREGVHVPLIIYIPDKYKHIASGENADPWIPGKASDRLVSFTDLAPTILYMAGAPIPSHMQGAPIIGSNAVKEPEYTFGFRDRHDCMGECARAVWDDRYIYIRNFLPHRGWRFTSYMNVSSPYYISEWQAAVNEELKNGSKAENRKTFFSIPFKPSEELYDLKADPYQMNNLAKNPDYLSVIARMREALKKWMFECRDLGLMPEWIMAEKSEKSTPYDMARNGVDYPLEKIFELALLAGEKEAGNIPAFISNLQDKNSAVRWWSVQGILCSASKTCDLESEAMNALKQCLDDECPVVRLAAAEALILLGDSNSRHFELAECVLSEILTVRDDILLIMAAIDTLDRLGTKVVNMLPLVDDLKEAGCLEKFAGISRYTQTIPPSVQYLHKEMR